MFKTVDDLAASAAAASSANATDSVQSNTTPASSVVKSVSGALTQPQRNIATIEARLTVALLLFVRRRGHFDHLSVVVYCVSVLVGIQAGSRASEQGG